MKNKNIDIEVFQYNSFVFGRIIEISETLKKYPVGVTIYNLDCDFGDAVGQLKNLTFKKSGQPTYSSLQIGCPSYINVDSSKPFFVNMGTNEKATNFIEILKKGLDAINDDKFYSDKDMYPHGAPVQLI